jgi:hypothetical protein
VYGHNLGVGAFGDLFGVAYMVLVAMREQNGVRGKSGRNLAGAGIALKEGVEQDGGSIVRAADGGVPVVVKFQCYFLQ